MINLVCSVYDTVSKVYAPPFYAVNRGDAIRSFSNAVNDSKMGDLNKHSKDFLLFALAEFDNQSGMFVPFGTPERLGLGSDFVEVKQ